MLANGRLERLREKKVGLIVASFTGGYFILLFITPLMLPTNTIPDGDHGGTIIMEKMQK
jgi:hypothetical protein